MNIKDKIRIKEYGFCVTKSSILVWRCNVLFCSSCPSNKQDASLSNFAGVYFMWTETCKGR